jgi:hypothetical protein
MSTFEDALWIILQLRPDHVYITPDGYKLYLLVNEELVRIDSARSFWAMTDAEVNAYIKDHFSQ